jgi:F-type H+-transporting ATPase subunit delta
LIGSRVSKRYAKALISLGKEDGNYQEYGDNLSVFAKLCEENPDFLIAISNQVFPVEDRRKILDTILERSGFSELVQNFLSLLLDKNRIGAIADIAAYYDRYSDEISNIARAEITTISPLKEDARKTIESVLGDFTSKKVKLEVKEDKSIIGGIIVKIGDLVLDGSVRAQLKGLNESLKRGDYS